ncbi:MAG: hypothetical protein JWP29_4675, partial [Rhodoferax sp.]|nr:hypothetical protein [Rhodoferax sp.]
MNYRVRESFWTQPHFSPTPSDPALAVGFSMISMNLPPGPCRAAIPQ